MVFVCCGNTDSDTSIIENGRWIQRMLKVENFGGGCRCGKRFMASILWWTNVYFSVFVSVMRLLHIHLIQLMQFINRKEVAADIILPTIISVSPYSMFLCDVYIISINGNGIEYYTLIQDIHSFHTIVIIISESILPFEFMGKIILFSL